ncbi:hypothetical protein [Streptomyces sp. NPDC006610]|uniref:hypothetical protein n=1 Tax=Streptomyces sp. NPDC006610 TaxID=3154584 RepID=UPI0033BCDDF9
MPRLSAKAARATIEAAELAKAPDWPDTRRWHVISGDSVLVVIEPSYRAGRREGWRPRLPDSNLYTSPPQPTREKAAATGLAAWERWATSSET